jgi:cell division initiation protein
MSFTAEDIQTKQFNVRFRGFDIEEVDSFLEQVAENYMLLAHEKKELSDELDKLKNDVEDFESREKTFHHAILAAQKIADEIEAKSTREAEEIVTNAQEEVKRLQKDANSEIVILQKQLDDLKDARNNIQGELKSYLTSCLDALERDEVPASLVSPVARDAGSFQGNEESSFASEEVEDELKDLYEKIDLPEEMDFAGIGLDQDDSPSEDEGEKGESFSDEPEDAEREALLPDLDGEMMFTMNDPVDMEHEPAVVIGTLEEEDERKNGE